MPIYSLPDEKNQLLYVRSTFDNAPKGIKEVNDFARLYVKEVSNGDPTTKKDLEGILENLNGTHKTVLFSYAVKALIKQGELILHPKTDRQCAFADILKNYEKVLEQYRSSK